MGAFVASSQAGPAFASGAFIYLQALPSTQNTLNTPSNFPYKLSNSGTFYVDFTVPANFDEIQIDLNYNQHGGPELIPTYVAPSGALPAAGWYSVYHGTAACSLPLASNGACSGVVTGVNLSNGPVEIGTQDTNATQFHVSPGGYVIAFRTGASTFTGGRPTIGGEIDLSSAPEPTTWALLILGVAMIGFAARRRNAGLARAA